VISRRYRAWTAAVEEEAKKLGKTGPAISDVCHCPLQEEDVIGVMPSASISELLPLGDRILIEVRHRNITAN